VTDLATLVPRVVPPLVQKLSLKFMQPLPTLSALFVVVFFLPGCVIDPVGGSDFVSGQISSSGAPDRKLPDPRFRPPFGFWEIDRVASMVAKASNSQAAGSIVVSEASALASIHGPLEAGEIHINPRAAATIPPNSWAFIIGHEFAHRTHEIGNHGQTSPEEEFRADVVGANYAIKAGFDLPAHIAWTLSRTSDNWSPSHGSLHDRANRLGAYYRIPREAVMANRQQY